MSTAFFDIASTPLGIPIIGAADSDFFLRTAGADQKVFIACGSNVKPAAVFSTSNMGVGGMAAPQFTLDVNGDINFTGKLYQMGQRYIGSQWTTSGDSNSISISSCNVGIGLSNPAFNLDVNGSVNFSGGLYQSGQKYIGSQWTTSSTSNAIAITSCNVGIGISTPASTLHVAGNSRFDGNIFVQNTYMNLTRLKVVQTQIPGAVGNISSIISSLPGIDPTISPFTFSLSNPQTDFKFQNSNSSNMLLIGQQSLSYFSAQAGAGSLKLVTPSTTASNSWWIGFSASNNNQDTNDRARIGTVLDASGNGSLYFTTGASNAQTEVMRITNTGFVGIGINNPSYKLHVDGTIYATGDIGAYSDIRLKCNLEQLENCLNKVKLCTGYRYNRRDQPDKNRKYIGLIAQQVEEIAPELIYEDTDGFKAIAYQNITAILIEAIKELSDKVDKIAKHVNLS